MKISIKIKIYNFMSWLLIGLTLLLAVFEQIKYIRETSQIGVISIIGFFTDVLLQPYFWVALILRWRIKENRKLSKG